MSQPTNCSICNSPDLTRRDEYSKCRCCGALRTIHNYSSEMYGVSYAMNYLEYAKSPINKSLNLFRLGLIARWISTNAKILDVGCCVGEFIKFAEIFYKCCGFEPNPVAAREATKRTYSRIISDLNGYETFDCITLFDVIEHIQEPRNFLNHLNSILNPKGILAITTPNVEAMSDEKWKHYKPKEHLYLYSLFSISKLLSDSRFEIIHIDYEESNIRPGNPNRDIMTCVAMKV